MENKIKIKKRSCPLCKETNYNNELYYNSKPWRLVQCECSFVYMPKIPNILFNFCIEKIESGLAKIDKNGNKEIIEKASNNPFNIIITSIKKSCFFLLLLKIKKSL